MSHVCPVSVTTSCNTVLRSFKNVCNGGFIKDGADHRKGNVLRQLLHHFKSLFNENANEEIQLKEKRLSDQTNQISGNIINAKKESDGGYRCRVTFGKAGFLITQSSSDRDITIRDENTGETAVLENVSFPELQKRLLVQYIKEQRNDRNLNIYLSSFDLIGINLSDVSFNDTVLSKQNLDAITTSGGNLTGATLAAGTDVTNVKLNDVRMDKAMAMHLIDAGADTRTVLINYLATEHNLKHVNIDIAGIDVKRVDSKGIDLRHVNLTGVQFAPIARADFDHALLKMLSVYSQTVSQILLKSNTLTL